MNIGLWSYLDNLLSRIREKYFFNSLLEWDGIVLGFFLMYESVVETGAHNQVLTVDDTNDGQQHDEEHRCGLHVASNICGVKRGII